MATKEQLIAALSRHFRDLDDGLHEIKATGRVIGFVASPDFMEADHEERQNRLWTAIDAEFTPDQQRNLGPITTMTPDEAKLHAADAD